ncbi:hypothetical protein [Candidatus Frankia alpina]|uniref:hypothetical protein n=1 Tax=Candidatus Frankia alpina TaxID=2699483 RepID=UPI0013D72680|nr:hypothetical protein [Candidatus Frankia alpina]
MLDAGLLAHRGYSVAGQALLAAASGLGHRPVAARLAVPEDTARLAASRPRLGPLPAKMR